MISGIIFFESGEIQQFGDIKSGRQITASIYQVLPQLLDQERKAVLEGMTIAELHAAIKAKQEEEV